LSYALSRHLIGDRDSEHDPILEELGLLRGNTVTERGMRIVSTYPLLGSGDKKRSPYPGEFFPFLLSSVLNGKVSARGDRFFQSGAFASRFPSLEKAKVNAAGAKAIEAFQKLGIISRHGSWFKLNDEAALSFMKLDEISKLAHVIYVDADLTTRTKGAKAIAICFLLSGVPSLDWDILKAKLEGYAGTYIPTEDYLAFHIFSSDENGTLTGRLRNGEKTTTGVVSSDNEMSYRGYVPYEVWRLAEPVTADTLTRWMITKSSIKGALDTGMTRDELVSLLRRFSGDLVPETLFQRIDTWVSQYKMARATRAVLLETDSRTNNILEQLPQMQEYILSHPAPNLFIMDSREEDHWRKELEAIGYDMLGNTKGPLFQEEDDVFGLLRLSEELDFPENREVPFRKEKYDALLS
ncbi:MAG: helicase-associated domain-containing protein, partial [Spirochaetales bacterium]|nr:helicase-associated domain-containing protein [Candidatus Physcosoma equi]